ncbi:MAG: CotH kinase family protein [Myxococcota bacterium]
MRLTRTLLIASIISSGLVGACGETAGTEDPEGEPAAAEDTSATESDAAQGEQPLADTAEDAIAEDDTEDEGPDAEGPPADGAQGLVINEIVAAAADGGNDWIELYVVGDQAVTLSDYTLVDDNPDHAPVMLPEVVVEPGQFFVIMAVDDGGPAVPSVPWKLGGDDGVWLARDGETIDSLDWEEGDTPEGTSWGRLPDGAADIALLTPTPGAPNVAWEGDKPEVVVEDDDCDLFPSDHVLSIQVVFSDSDWQAVLASPASETYYEANVTIDGVTTEQIAVRTKGNSSLNSVANNQSSNRYSWKLDMNRYVDGQKLCGLKKFNLNNGFKDPSLLREHIGYRLATDIGLPAPRTSFADVTVNGQHLGVYTLVEHVDSEFIERWFDDDEGDLYKPDWPDGHLQWQGDAFTDYDGVELQSNEETSDYSAFIALLEVINGDADVTTVLDVDMMIRYLALNSLLVNLDSYSGNGHNYYVYEVDGVFTPIPWDLNEAFGNFTCGCSRAEIIGLLIDDPTCGALATKPMAERVLTDPTSVDLYHAHLAEFIADGGPFSDAVIAANIEAAATLIRPYVEADTEKFFSTQDFETAIHSDVGNAIGLTTFVTERRAAIAAQLDGSAASSSNGEGSCGNGGPGGGGPGGGGPGGGGQNPKCPDGICDAVEQANPGLCPEDCD